MRIVIILTTILVLAFLALAVVLVVPGLGSPDRIEYGTAIQSVEPLLSRVPAGAVDVVVVPAAAGTYRALQNHPVASEPLRRFAAQNRLPPGWVLGPGPLVIWRAHDGSSGAALRVDALRRLILPIFGSRSGIRVEDDLAILGQIGSGFRVPAEGPADRAHFFALRRDGAPVVAGVVIDEPMRLVARLRGNPVPGKFLAGPVALPQSAIVAAAFASPPELIDRIEQTLPVQISRLLERGGVVALYQLNDERLLPRPRGVVVLPADERSFPELKRRLEQLSPELPFGIAAPSRREVHGHDVVRRESIGFTLEYTRRGSELLVAFDKSSIEKFLADRQQVFETGEGSVEWLVRFDPRQLVPALHRVRRHAGIAVLVPELGRRIDQWTPTVEWIEQASEVLAIKRRRGGEATLDVTIASPK